MDAIDLAQERAPSVLVVEDDAPLLRSLVRAFRASGARPVGVSSLSQARVELVARAHEAFVLDVGLPDGRGTSLLDEIRALAPRAPIVVCTGQAERAARAQALDVDAAYVEKPFENSVVTDLVAWIGHVRACEPRSSARESATRLRAPSFVGTRDHATCTPRGVRRMLIRGATNAPLCRVPDATDTVVLLGKLDDVPMPKHVHALRVRSESGTAMAAACSARSIVGIVVDGCAGAIDDPTGVLTLMRAERHETPVLVLAGSVPPSAASMRALALAGIAHVTGPRDEQHARAFAFADELSLEADLRRRVLDTRALAWGLTRREAELTWLASMIVSRERVERLFDGGGFRAQLEAARGKVGARSFDELGRLARG